MVVPLRSVQKPLYRHKVQNTLAGILPARDDGAFHTGRFAVAQSVSSNESPAAALVVPVLRLPMPIRGAFRRPPRFDLAGIADGIAASTRLIQPQFGNREVPTPQSPRRAPRPLSPEAGYGHQYFMQTEPTCQPMRQPPNSDCVPLPRRGEALRIELAANFLIPSR